MTSRQRFLAVVVLAVLAGPAMSGALHEAGHALVVWWYGGHLTTFQPFWFLGAPHIHFDGELGATGVQWLPVSGVAGVVLISWMALAVIPFPRLPHRWAVAAAVVILCHFSQLIAWVVLPWLALAGMSYTDDVFVFLRETGWPPAVVGLGSAGLLILTTWWFLRRTELVPRLRALRGISEGDFDPSAPFRRAGGPRERGETHPPAR